MNDNDEPDVTPIHVFDVTTKPDGQPTTEVREVNVVAPKLKPFGGSIFKADFGPALKKLDELDAGKGEPPPAA